MYTQQIGGPVGPFPDPITKQPVPCRFHGTATYTCQGDPGAIGPQVAARVQLAVGTLVAEKLATNQVALMTLAQSVPYYVNEIIAKAQVENLGAQITQLTIAGFEVQMAAPAAPPQPMVMPPTPMESAANALKQAASDRLDPRNYRVEAKVNVGGFKIKASSDGGLDTEGLKNQAADKAKSAVIWYAAGCLIVGVVILGLCGLGGYIYYQIRAESAPAAGPAKAATWDGKSEFSCAANDNVKLEGIAANLTTGTAIKAAGNCKLELVNCNITAPVGIETSANAAVQVKGGSVNSSQFSVKALGTSKVEFSKTTKVTGKTQALGGAKVTGP